MSRAKLVISEGTRLNFGPIFSTKHHDALHRGQLHPLSKRAARGWSMSNSSSTISSVPSLIYLALLPSLFQSVLNFGVSNTLPHLQLQRE